MSSATDVKEQEGLESKSAASEIRGYDPAQDLLGKWPFEPSSYYPGHTFLGRGYHVLTGKYADADSLMGDVIEKEYDWHYWGGPTWRGESVKYCANPKVDNIVNRTVEHFAVTGSTIDELRRKLSVRLGFEGRYKVYSGSVNSEFNAKDSFTHTYEYAHYQNEVRVVRVGFAATDPSKLPVTDSARKLIDDPSVPPGEVFEQLGTHFVAELFMGARLMAGITTNTSLYTSEMDLSVVAEASVNKLIGQAKFKVGSELGRAVEN